MGETYAMKGHSNRAVEPHLNCVKKLLVSFYDIPEGLQNYSEQSTENCTKMKEYSEHMI